MIKRVDNIKKNMADSSYAEAKKDFDNGKNNEAKKNLKKVFSISVAYYSMFQS